jgi:DNA-binding transcriptional ArsR family regulator
MQTVQPHSHVIVDAAPIFAALGDPTRLRIVAQLCASGPQSIVRLTDGAHVTRQAISKHLHSLARAGLVRATPHGRERIWEIEPQRLVDVVRCIDEISTQWNEAISRLRLVVSSAA